MFDVAKIQHVFLLYKQISSIAVLINSIIIQLGLRRSVLNYELGIMNYDFLQEVLSEKWEVGHIHYLSLFTFNFSLLTVNCPLFTSSPPQTPVGAQVFQSHSHTKCPYPPTFLLARNTVSEMVYTHLLISSNHHKE